jgi:hypothetical protein
MDGKSLALRAKKDGGSEESFAHSLQGWIYGDPDNR